MSTTLDSLVARNGLTVNAGVGSLNFTNASATSPVLQVNITGDSQPRIELDSDGTISWGTGAATRDIWLVRGAANTLWLGTTKNGTDASLGLGKIAVNVTVGGVPSGYSAAIQGSFTVGQSMTNNSSTGNYNISFGQGHTIAAAATRCFVTGNNNSIAGSSNSALGDAVLVTTTGSKNVALVSGKITGTTNYSGVMGDATISGASTSCFAIGASGGSISGKSGSVIIGDNNSAGTFSPGNNNMLQVRFNGGAVTGAAAYWFSSDVNSNGVKLNYQDNSWGPIGSDARLKNKVSEVDYSGVLNAFEKVPIYRYTYKHDKDGGCDKNGCTAPPRLRTGFFANEYNAAFGSFIEPRFSPEHPYHTEHPEDTEPIHTYSHDDLMFMNFCGIKALTERVKRLEAGGGGSVADSSRLVDRVERLERNAETVQLFKPSGPTASNEEVVALQKKVDVLTKTLQAILKNPKMLLNSPELLKYVESNGEVGLDDDFTTI